MLEHFSSEAASIGSSAWRLSLPSDMFCCSGGNPLGWHYPWLSALLLCCEWNWGSWGCILIPNCTIALFCTFTNTIINVLDCELKDLVAHIHFCHICHGFLGCIQREVVAAESQKEWEHDSAINFTKKDVTALEMFRLVFQNLIWLSHSLLPRF